jgi:NAD(P)-dependent dehydrogenase (short-subunit alcohol dehydrogenase family)
MKAALVTGASTGIGEATAKRLASDGFDVFAGVRSEEDAARLRDDGLITVRVDVTDEASIAAARDEVARHVGDAGLAALVNNAGIAIAAPLELIPIEELRRQLDVNLIGQVAVIQAFLPLLRAGGGRIVNVSSIGGRMAVPLNGAYAASKFGLEAVSDSLRRELRGQGVEVIVIEPGGVKTPIWEKGTSAADRMLEGVPSEDRERYAPIERALRAEAMKIATERGAPPSAVADVIAGALAADKPRTRYLVGRDAKARALMARFLPDRLFDRLIERALRG